MIWLLPLVLAGLYLLYRGFFVEPDALRLEQVDVKLQRLPVELEGMRLLHATDLHLRDEPWYEEKLLHLVRLARPDAIVLTGDYVDNETRFLALERVAGKLAAVCPVYASLGDNDVEGAHVRAEDVQLALERGGVKVLRNRGEYVGGKVSPLFLAGIDDPRAPSASLQKALFGRHKDDPTVLLAHSAEIYRDAEAAGVELLLAGHTHGGQVCLPFYGALYTNDRLGHHFASGMIRHGQLQMHVGRGVGWAKLHVRFFCPPEVTLIRLQRG